MSRKENTQEANDSLKLTQTNCLKCGKTRRSFWLKSDWLGKWREISGPNKQTNKEKLKIKMDRKF